MSDLLLKMKVDLLAPGRRTGSQYQGVRFRRWIPNGEQDAITLPTDLDGLELKIWFDRKGVENRIPWIRHISGMEHEGKEVGRDPSDSALRDYLAIDSGPLYGSAKYTGATEDELRSLQEGGEYKGFGIQIYKAIQRPLAQVANIFRISYGQYWIEAPLEWDPEKWSIGYCCKELSMQWSLDRGQSWEDFLPNEPKLKQSGGGGRGIPPMTHAHLHPNKEQWEALPKTVENYPEASLAAESLIETRRLGSLRDYKRGLIEGVTALELVIEDFYRKRIAEFSNDLKGRSMNTLGNLGMKQKAALVLPLLDVAVEDVEKTVQAIDLRNAIVHDGKSPHLKDMIFAFDALVRVVAFFLPHERVTHYYRQPAYAKGPPGKWGQYGL